MEKVKHVKFYLYKAVTMLDPKFNDRYQLVRQKIDEFGDGEAERAGWTQAKIESLNLWKRHRDQTVPFGCRIRETGHMLQADS